MHNSFPALTIPRHSNPLKRAILMTGLFSSLILTQGCSSLTSTAPETGKAQYSTAINSAQTQLIAQKPLNPPRVTETTISKQEIVQEHYDIVWPEITPHFNLAKQHMGKYDRLIEFYQKRKKHLEASFSRSEPYFFYIKNQVASRNMPMEIALLPVVESGFIPRARSHKKAVGLWQFIPSTGKMYGLEQNWWFDGRSDLVKSTKAALDFLQDLYKQNDGDWLLALASYNAGYGAVLRAQKRYRKKHPQTSKDAHLDFWQLQPFLPKETARYVPKLLATAHLLEYADTYGIEVYPVDNNAHFEIVHLNKQVSLNAIASVLEISKDTLLDLNPGYRRAATPPLQNQDKHHLLLPIDQAQTFKQLFAENPEKFTVQWQRHKVKSGDYLGKIANQYGTRVAAIKQLNHLRNSNIRVNQTLLIPIASSTSNKKDDTKTHNKNTKPTTTVVKASEINSKKTSLMLASADASSHAGEFINYTVQNGDSLWKIANNFSVSVKDLKTWNNLSKETLRQNQTLKIAQIKTLPAGNSSKKQNTFRVKKSYKIQNGDVLSVIAEDFGVSVSQIKKWNSLTSNTIRPGQTLSIWQGPDMSKHKEYKVKNGDNLWLIAKNHKLSTRILARYNSISINTTLRPGQVLKIPFKI
ncbi:LysM peptidoglycan-binding domain-containing protein [Thiomicrorhabdus indica]|uniref:lytic transglycosylase n=1 Tax=Thiomicrorhabdus indica TaxID=2267253 RepID=UPI002AA600B1|nr:LysM peptidoglycan-binding domain-containing protein [Thiomicrorhabdus indica]